MLLAFAAIGAVTAQDVVKVPEALIAGTVLSATTSESLKSVVVSLRSGKREDGISKVTTSGLEGDFVFTGLPPGEYELTFRKTGYRTLHGSVVKVTVRENEEVDGLVLRMWPAGAIEGRVVDSEGEPVPGAQVATFRVRHGERGIFLSSGNEVKSNDLGRYRIYGLGAGAYLVRVWPPREGTPGGEYYAGMAGTFYPDATGPLQALPLKVNWGQELSGIDLRLTESVTYAAAGSVWDAHSEGPCLGCIVRAEQIDGALRISLPSTARTSREGRFVLRRLSPGEYRIVARRPGAEGVVSQAHISIRGRNAEGVDLAVGVMGPVSGRIVLDDTREGVDPTAWTPYLSSIPPSTSWPDGEGEVDADHRFSIPELPAANYRFEVLGLPPGSYLKALRVGGQPLPAPELAVPEDAPVTGVQAVIGFDAATVSGQVKPRRSSSGKEGPIEARVALIPKPNQGGYVRTQTVQTTPDGGFSFASVVPGAYTLYALPVMSSAQLMDPAVQASLRSYTRQLDLEPSESATVELTLGPDPE